MSHEKNTIELCRLLEITIYDISLIRFNAGYDFATSKLPAYPVSVWNNTMYWNWWMRIASILEASFLYELRQGQWDQDPESLRYFLTKHSRTYMPGFWSQSFINSGSGLLSKAMKSTRKKLYIADTIS